jgi:hypothetical protein
LPSTSLGFATGAIHTDGGDWFTTTGSGVLTGSKPTGYSTNFAVEYRGKLRITSAGNYTFATRSDDGSALWINPGVENPPYSSAVVQNNFPQGMTSSSLSDLLLTQNSHQYTDGPPPVGATYCAFFFAFRSKIKRSLDLASNGTVEVCESASVGRPINCSSRTNRPPGTDCGGFFLSRATWSPSFRLF